MARRFRWLAPILMLLAAGAAGAAEGGAEAANPFNAKLLGLTPAARAAELAKAVGHLCIGTDAFAMGVTKTGRSTGYAYWSLHCADGTAWAIQIDPLGAVTAIDCADFNKAAAPKECFKRF